MENDIQQILNSLSQARVDDFKTWLEVGMALHASGEPCSTWENWSRRSSKFKDGECAKRWATFGNYSGSPVTIASVAKMAIEDGYKPSVGFGFDDPIGRFENPKTSQKAQNIELKEYLTALFKSGDIVNFVVDSFEKDGKMLPCGKGVNKPFDELISACNRNTDISYVLGDWNEPAGAWVRFNPMNGNGCKNSDVAEYRHCLIESDSLSKEEQLRKIREFNLPCAAIVDSGGKSIHAIVKIDAGMDENLYRERVHNLHKFLESKGFPVDKACKNASRLSRIAAVTRNGTRQSLLAVNVGAKSYTDWEAHRDIQKLIANNYDDVMKANASDMSDCILGNRHLCKQCPWLIVAASGVGKSVLAMQMAILFGCGRDLWGLSPHKPRSVVLIQAENNFLDLVEPAQSISRILKLTEDEKALLRKNFHVVTDDTHSGSGFVKAFDIICETYHPEIVIVDPLMAYIGGDISKSEVCAKFFRNELNPVVHKHDVALIVLHHTGKPKAQELRKFASSCDMEYLGIGSSDITNWARAISVILPSVDDENVFEFTHCKRGKRVGGKQKVYLRQGESSKDIFWYETDKPSKPVTAEKVSRSKYAYLELEVMPPKKHDKDTSKSEVIAYIQGQLAKHGDPADVGNAFKVYEAVRKNNPLIVYEKPYWHGRLYISESSTGTIGGSNDQ